MTSSLHSTAALTFLPILANLSDILGKAEVNATDRKIDPSVFLSDRLAPDMLNLTRQVQIACDHAKSALYRISGLPVPSVPDTETTFAELRARIARTVELFGAVPADQVNGKEAAQIELKFPWGDMSFTGQGFLLGYSIPNFYFHIITAYNILRHNGVPLGKGDFLARK